MKFVLALLFGFVVPNDEHCVDTGKDLGINCESRECFKKEKEIRRYNGKYIGYYENEYWKHVDDEDSKKHCCKCSGGHKVDPLVMNKTCNDISGQDIDAHGDGCDWYTGRNVKSCGLHDTESFKAK